MDLMKRNPQLLDDNIIKGVVPQEFMDEMLKYRQSLPSYMENHKKGDDAIKRGTLMAFQGYIDMLDQGDKDDIMEKYQEYSSDEFGEYLYKIIIPLIEKKFKPEMQQV